MKVLFENGDLIVVVKPVGVSSEEGMPALLRQAWGDESAYVGVVHRLDTPVGGVMAFAKNKKAAADLSCQVADGVFKKAYNCVCAGIFEEKTGEMRDFLFKDSRQNKVFPVKGQRKGAKEAILRYQVMAEAKLGAEGTPASLCRVELVTGRTHQIRVQFASRKHPLVGDGKYGSRIKSELALWCRELTFVIPGEGVKTFEAAYPEVFPFDRFGG